MVLCLLLNLMPLEHRYDLHTVILRNVDRLCSVTHCMYSEYLKGYCELSVSGTHSPHPFSAEWFFLTFCLFRASLYTLVIMITNLFSKNFNFVFKNISLYVLMTFLTCLAYKVGLNMLHRLKMSLYLCFYFSECMGYFQPFQDYAVKGQ